MEHENNESSECKICYLRMDFNNQVKLLPCNHQICMDCLNEIAIENGKCPFDRRKIIDITKFDDNENKYVTIPIDNIICKPYVKECKSMIELKMKEIIKIMKELITFETQIKPIIDNLSNIKELHEELFRNLFYDDYIESEKIFIKKCSEVSQLQFKEILNDFPDYNNQYMDLISLSNKLYLCICYEFPDDELLTRYKNDLHNLILCFDNIGKIKRNYEIIEINLNEFKLEYNDKYLYIECYEKLKNIDQSYFYIQFYKDLTKSLLYEMSTTEIDIYL